jgi:hypothetical protein
VFALVTLLILAVPAGAIAFFAVCYGTVVTAAAANTNIDTSIRLGTWLGAVAALGVTGGIIYFAIRGICKSQR